MRDYDATKPNLLVSLPRELRDMIYDDVLASATAASLDLIVRAGNASRYRTTSLTATDINHWISAHAGTKYPSTRRANLMFEAAPSLLLVNKQISAEALELWHSYPLTLQPDFYISRGVADIWKTLLPSGRRMLQNARRVDLSFHSFDIKSQISQIQNTLNCFQRVWKERSSLQVVNLEYRMDRLEEYEALRGLSDEQLLSSKPRRLARLLSVNRHQPLWSNTKQLLRTARSLKRVANLRGMVVVTYDDYPNDKRRHMRRLEELPLRHPQSGHPMSALAAQCTKEKGYLFRGYSILRGGSCYPRPYDP